MKKVDERRKAIVCMEFLARQVNDEGILMSWLMSGVPDGDIEYGNLDIDAVYSEDYMVSDEGFKDIMSTFLRCMYAAYNDGGLYCGGIVSRDKSDYKKEV